MSDRNKPNLLCYRRYITVLILLPALLFICGQANADKSPFDCGKISNPYGPFDYTNPVHVSENLPIVEKFHFTPEVEGLIRGKSDNIPGDLDYTLRAFPNHHRALYSMAKYQLTHERPPVTHYYTAECYFIRAMKFKPEDAKVRLIYGIYLHKKDQLEEAEKRYLEALEMLPESGETHYNLGLLYTDMKKYEKAKEHAKKAYDSGYPLPGLKNRLIRAGQWN